MASSINASEVTKALNVGTGMDIQSIAQALADAKVLPQKERVQKDLDSANARISGYSALKFGLTLVEDALNTVNDKNDFNVITSVSSDSDAVTVDADSDATTGRHEIEVSRLAYAQRSASAGFAAGTSTINSGNAFNVNITVGGTTTTVQLNNTAQITESSAFSSNTQALNSGSAIQVELTINGSKSTIDVSAGSDTPQGIVDAINGAGLGVTATFDSGIATVSIAIGSTFSGDYTDLTNKPTIPTNNNQLTNGAGYTTFDGAYSSLSGRPTIPTNNNQLTNGAEFITASDNITGTSAGLTGTPNITVGSIIASTGTFSGNVTIGGTLTYEDVTNIDSVGLITARSGIKVGSGITLSPDGDGFFTGVTTATTFIGALTGTASNATQLNSQAASYYLDYDNFSNTPTIPTNNNQLTNGAGYITGSALNASNLSSGTIPDARFPSTLPAIDGSALTGIAGTANVRTGILDVAGIATFRNDTLVGSGITLSPDGDGFYTGIVTATSFVGDGSALTNLPAGTSDKISEGNTKAEVEDTGSTGRFFVETEGTERFSIDRTGDFTFNTAHDNVINANGQITIDYKMYNSIKIRNFTKTDGFYFYPLSDAYPFVIGSGFGSDEIKFYRTGDITVGSSIKLNSPSGIITATKFVGDGSELTGIGGTANVRTGILDVAGIATFRNDTLIGTGVTLSPDGDIFATGVTTSTSFVGDLTGDVTGTASNATLAVSAQGLTGSPNVTVTNVNAVDAIISGNLSVAGTITSLDQNDILATGIITASSGVDLGDPGIVTLSSDTLTTTSSSQDTVASVSATVNRSATFQVQVTRGTEYHVTTINVVHDGTNAFLSEYGTIRTGSILATFDADISGGNLRLRVTPTSTASTVFKLSKTTIKV